MSKEFKVGLIAVVSGVLLYYGFNFLKGIDFFSPTDKYYALYDNVDGLNKSNPVIINGLAVGRVSRIKLLQNGENQILVELDIDETITLGKNSEAVLTSTDFLGSKGIILSLGDINDPIEAGDTLISTVDKGLDEIIETAAPITGGLETTINRVNEILIGLKGSGEKINETLGQVQETTIKVNQIISDNQVELAQIMSRTAVLVAGLNKKLDQLDPITMKTEAVLDSVRNLQINETLATVQVAVNKLTETLDEVKDEKGTLGRLMKDDSLYTNLNQTMVDLDKLIIHMDQYPKHFFAPLGKSHKKVMKDINSED